jgi:hypothetical protein
MLGEILREALGIIALLLLIISGNLITYAIILHIGGEK